MTELLKKKINITKDKFWYNDISILYNNARLDEFFPSKDMTTEEKLNSLVRLSIYISIILFLLNKNSNYFYICLSTLFITFIIYKFNNQENFNDINNTSNYSNNSNSNYVSPTLDNPFMNIQFDDYIKNPNREALSKVNNYNNPKLLNNIEENFNYNLYTDMSDIFGKNNSQRQFYTMPVTTIPNDQKGFANWLYKTDKTCKENNGEACVRNIYNNLKASSKYRINV